MKKIKLDKIVVWEYTCKRIPILTWLPKYGLVDSVSDLIAGFTVGLTLMPQAIAYAALAGLEPQYGLYSAFAGSFVYIIFGTIKEVNIGPTAIISLLTFNYTHDTNPHFVVLLCFLSGVVELLCGILHLGFIIEFVSVPVTAGFSSAAAVIIATSQLKGLLGLTFHSENFIDDWVNIIWNISETRLWDLCLSVGCCVILLLMRQLKNIKFKDTPLSTTKKIFNNSIWFLSISRNAIIVISTATIAYVLTRNSSAPFLLTGKVESGFPSFELPPTSTTIGNTTYTFLDMCNHLGTGIIFVPLISIIANIAIAKAFADGKIVDATQEMMTLGICNIIGSFFQSMPVTGAFSRSAVNHASGVRTPLGGLYSGVLIVLTLGFLTPYFFYIPKATLASVIICAVVFMVEIKLISYIWKTNKKDLIPFLITFGACLWQGVEMGILLGLLVDIIYLLYVSARPACTSHKLKDTYSQEYIVVSPSSGLLFPAVDHIREQVILASKDSGLPVVLDFKHVSKIDYTGIEGLKALKEDMKKTNQRLFFQNVQPDILTKLKQHLGSDVSTINALGELLQGGRKISGSDLFTGGRKISSSDLYIGGRKISSSLIRPEILGQAISDIEKDPTLLGRLRKYSRMGDLLYSHQEKTQF